MLKLKQKIIPLYASYFFKGCRFWESITQLERGRCDNVVTESFCPSQRRCRYVEHRTSLRRLSDTSPRRHWGTSWKRLNSTYQWRTIGTSPRRLRLASNETPNDNLVALCQYVSVVRAQDLHKIVAATSQWCLTTASQPMKSRW